MKTERSLTAVIIITHLRSTPARCCLWLGLKGLTNTTNSEQRCKCGDESRISSTADQINLALRHLSPSNVLSKRRNTKGIELTFDPVNEGLFS